MEQELREPGDWTGTLTSLGLTLVFLAVLLVVVLTGLYLLTDMFSFGGHGAAMD